MLSTKADLVKRLTAHPKLQDIPEYRLKDFVNAFIDTLPECLATEGDEIRLIGFGRFKVEIQPARSRRNPRTGEMIQKPAAQVIRFKSYR